MLLVVYVAQQDAWPSTQQWERECELDFISVVQLTAQAGAQHAADMVTTAQIKSADGFIGASSLLDCLDAFLRKA